MSAGKKRSRPAELLSQKNKVQELLQSLKEFDCIVIDSAPVLAVSDSLLIAPSSEAVVLVIRARKTQPKEITRALQLLNQVGANVSGFVLNQLPLRQTYSYAAYAGDYVAGAT
jgi:Mrp family chromosome partitioning ATPase